MYLRNHSTKETKESRVKAEPVINVTRLPFYVILSNICECGVAGAGGRVSGPVTSAAPLRLWSHVAGRMLPSRSYQPRRPASRRNTARHAANQTSLNTPTTLLTMAVAMVECAHSYAT